jgi:hypothetical protein
MTVTTLRTSYRPRKLSLVAARLPPILNLPVELALTIFELAISESKPTALIAICKATTKAVEAILYRTVVLDTPQTTLLFYRTTLSKPRAFFIGHVKKLIVAWEPYSDPCPTVAKIMAACPALRALVSPSCYMPISTAMQTADGPFEITFQSYEGSDASKVVPPLEKISRPLTHLRFCEPSDGWHSPSSMLSTFGPLPHLSHLQLSRRAGANVDNDVAFAEDIRTILRSNSNLKVVVVSIFAGPSWSDAASETAEDSDIWRLMRDIQDVDQRIVVVNGVYDKWREEMKYRKSLWSGCYPVDFWTAVKG